MKELFDEYYLIELLKLRLISSHPMKTENTMLVQFQFQGLSRNVKLGCSLFCMTLGCVVIGIVVDYII